MRRWLVSVLLLTGVAGWAAGADSETVTLEHETQVPGTTLKPGSYRFEVEDRMQDRAIVRITAASGDSHELVLAVPSKKLSSADTGLIFFGDRQVALRGWKCASCTVPLEFVYPKDQAVAVMESTAKPVMAVDPTYDKLPKNLSQDDMKVVTLWLLNPKEITPEGKVEGVQPVKYAQAMKPKMPKTASHDVEFGVAGGVLLLLGGESIEETGAVRRAAIFAMVAGILGGLLLSYGQRQPAAPSSRDEITRLRDHNRRLEALVQVLREQARGHEHAPSHN